MMYSFPDLGGDRFYRNNKKTAKTDAIHRLDKAAGFDPKKGPTSLELV